jgi:hypothetical protein
MWHGSPIPGTCIRYIESVQDRLKFNDKYVFIGDSRYIDKSLITVDFRDYVEENIKSRNDEIKELWDLYDKEVKNNPEHKQIKYDFVRLFYASQNEDVFYLDTDVILKKRPDFKDTDLPYFGLIPDVGADIFLFYSKGNFKFFHNLLLQTKDIEKKPGVFLVLLKKYNGQINYLKENCYSHVKCKELVEDFSIKFKMS